MKLPFYLVDVFAEKKYAGNQLAVFLDAENLSDSQMQTIAQEINFAESTFITNIDFDNSAATIRIFTPEYEMKFAGHPIIGTAWVLMNKILKNRPENITLSVPIGIINVKQSGDLVWLQASQPEFFSELSAEELNTFSNLEPRDIDTRFPVQEVSTGSAFVIVPLSNLSALENLALDMKSTDEWLKNNCKTVHRALYFYCLEDGELHSRMLYVGDNQLKEDAATGSASTCLQAYLLKYTSQKIDLINHQGNYINRPSQIYFNGELSQSKFEISIGGKTQFIAKGEWEAL